MTPRPLTYGPEERAERNREFARQSQERYREDPERKAQKRARERERYEALKASPEWPAIRAQRAADKAEKRRLYRLEHPARVPQTEEERKAKARAKNKQWYENNRERIAEYNRKYRVKKPKPKGEHYKRMFGITEDDYQRMLAEQGGVCRICDDPPKKYRLHVDHCHTTGRVRGLLCARCNTRLGIIESAGWAEWINRAEGYLQANPAEGVDSTRTTP